MDVVGNVALRYVKLFLDPVVLSPLEEANPNPINELSQFTHGARDMIGAECEQAMQDGCREPFRSGSGTPVCSST